MIKRVLVIDTDYENYKEIQANLQDATTVVHYSATIQDALLQMSADSFCLIIMDVLLSGCGCHDMVLSMRECTPMPILVLSEQVGTADKVLALEAGADDFLEKPYDMDECLARARVLLRRYTEYHRLTQRCYALVGQNDVMIDTGKRVIYMDGIEIALTKTEFGIVYLFIKNRGQVLSYEQIYESVWKEEYLENKNTISYHIAQLRKKLSPYDFIESVPSVGYRLKEADRKNVFFLPPNAK